MSGGEFEGESEEELPPEGFETYDNVEQSRTTVNTIDSDQEQGDETYFFTPPSAKQGKHKAVSAVPKLIDNKRKHLERNLSAAHRDQIFIKETKNDAEFRRDLAQAMRESNECFSDSVKEISKSITELSKGLCSSMEMLSWAVCVQQPALQQQQPMHQNLFYQNVGGIRQQPTSGYYTHMLNQNDSAEMQEMKTNFQQGQ